MKIKEVEELTGITKQNIRYYEKKGLLNPDRNQENDYREYSMEDVERLKIIKLFRKLDMPIEEIKKLLCQDIDLQQAIAQQKEILEKEKERLSDALSFCNKIKESEITSLDTDHYLKEMEREEQNGATFADFINDYKKVIKAESQQEFSFVPDNMCMNPAEFTESLCKFGTEKNLNIVITKEGMYPEFTVDGVEYVADRYFTRYGAVVRCQMKYPAEAIPEGMSSKKYNRFVLVRRLVMFAVMVVLIMLMVGGPSLLELIVVIPVAIIMAGVYSLYFVYYRNLKN